MSAPSGWYPDPGGPPGTVRWWTGGAWTEHTQGTRTDLPPPPFPYAPAPYAPAPYAPAPFGRLETNPLADYGTRLGGWLLDWLILALVSTPVLIFAGTYSNSFTTTTNAPDGQLEVVHTYNWGVNWQVFLAYAVLVVAYGTFLCGSRRGQTLGMMVVGVRVVRTDGTRVGYVRAFLRGLLEYALFVVAVVPWIVDMLFPAWDDKRQTLHDKAVDTVVIRRDAAWPPERPPADSPWPSHWPSQWPGGPYQA